jgi:hypothetical protein
MSHRSPISVVSGSRLNSMPSEPTVIGPEYSLSESPRKAWLKTENGSGGMM